MKLVGVGVCVGVGTRTCGCEGLCSEKAKVHGVTIV